MVKIVNIGKLEITYDLEDILRKVDSWVYDKYLYDGRGEYNLCEEYSYSEDEWLKAKNKFMKEIENLISNENELIDLISKNVSTNKNGSMSKNRRNVVLKFSCVNSYNDSYGSHSFYVNALVVQRISEFEGNLQLSEYKDQSSF